MKATAKKNQASEQTTVKATPERCQVVPLRKDTAAKPNEVPPQPCGHCHILCNPWGRVRTYVNGKEVIISACQKTCHDAIKESEKKKFEEYRERFPKP